MISVCITAYRRPAYLIQSVGSVLAQTFRGFELLIGLNPDDQEYPELRRVAHCFECIDPRIRLVDCRCANTGFAKGQRLVREAKYTYASGLDYDDVWMPNKLELQVPFLGKYDVISARGVYFGERSGVIETPTGKIERSHFAIGNPIVSPTVICRVEDAKKCDPAYATGPYDYKLWVDMVNAGKTFYALPEILAFHRVESGSAYNSGMNQDVVRSIGRMVKT